jgi:hypothetical protein
MKRISLPALFATALALCAPAGALAHHARSHHAARRTSAHGRHASVARVLRFGSAASRAGASPATASSSTETTPSAAGTITSFSAGVLTITLTDGTVVSGRVTERTEIECRSSAPEGEASGGDEAGEDGGSGGGEGGSDGGDGSDTTATHGGDSHGGSGGDDGAEGVGEEACTTAALVGGALVGEAELRTSSEGAAWLKVELA